MLRAIILDFNGVIVDDEHVHYELLRDLVAPLGLNVSQKDYLEKYVVYRDEEAFSRALADAGRNHSADEVEKLVKEKRRLYMTERLGSIRVFPGACRFVETAAAMYPLAIASGAARQEIEALLDHLHLSSYIRTIVAAEDVSRGKPEPDIYVEAVKRLAISVPQLAAREVLAVEDTPGGIESARHAGLRVAAVTNTFPAEDLAGADLIITDGLEAFPFEAAQRLFEVNA